MSKTASHAEFLILSIIPTVELISDFGRVAGRSGTKRRIDPRSEGRFHEAP
jgi:hypothetical protein